MYHERQSLQRCLQHTLNNLLQRPAFGAADLDATADALGGAQRNRWLLPSGNWDANTLLAALAPLGLDVRWHDARDSDLARLDLTAPGLFGLVLNTPGHGWWSALTGGRHWLAIRRLGGAWWNLDSRLSAPVCFAGAGEGGGGGGGNRADGGGSGSGGGSSSGGGGGGGSGGGSGDGAGELREFLRGALAGGSQLLLIVGGAEGGDGGDGGAEGGSGSSSGGGAGPSGARADSGGG
ncbi:hypothetical protein Rsub_00584 [Raphidocelis subcapitata]|uniref:ubiquitinyl hydrolase 1 n=1 Tax=Raphidocelis subcapitata TaxID=307507 RepID=A0A2V0NN37_9CHLO|nr:hypothetical protein Rsub_00584 [Raphidocelis subcapitata]|eukprot:GBF87872.1 hypothetical protein Rsub_00584 [Raphidocelis subcapitata]